MYIWWTWRPTTTTQTSSGTPRSGLNLAVTVLRVPNESGRDCLMYAVTVLYVP